MHKPQSLIRVCCVCRQTEHNGKWDNHQHHTLELIAKLKQPTHGFCPPCLADWYKQAGITPA